MVQSLLLDNNFEPLCFIDQYRLMRLFCRGKIDVLDYGNGPSMWSKYINFPNQKLQVPAVVKLKKKVKIAHQSPRFHKRALFNRDYWTCQYCSRELHPKEITVDHVVPRSRGGQTSWLNCVAACRDCNTKKRDMSPEQAGLKLRKQPTMPTRYTFLQTNKRSEWHPDWSYFIS